MWMYLFLGEVLCLVVDLGGGGHGVCGAGVVLVLVEVDVKEAEDEPEHGGAEAVAEPAHAGHHALHEALLVRGGVHRHERRDRREGDAGGEGRIFFTLYQAKTQPFKGPANDQLE